MQATLMAFLMGAVAAPPCPADAAPAAPRAPLNAPLNAPLDAPLDAPLNAPLARVLGIAPGTTEARAHRILSRLGERLEESEGAEEEEGGAGLGRELWRLRDPRYAWVQLAVDVRHRVKAIQAHLRADGPGLRYAEIGDLAAARRLGYTILEWRVPASAQHPGRRVTARGADSVFAATVAIAAD